MPSFSAKQLMTLTARIFEKKGANRENAATVARLLVRANLAGHDSHGIIRISSYASLIDRGKLDPRARGTMEMDQGAVGLVNGNRGFGQVVATDAMRKAIDKGKEYGVGVVSIHNCGHIGRMADYSMLASDEDMIGITMVNAAPVVAPFGGVERIFNPSPIGAAIPASDHPPFVLDISMSVSAAGKVLVKNARGEKLPPGWILDKDGGPSVEPKDFLDGGTLLPMGGDVGYKGYGLAFLVDILSGALSGNGCSSSKEFRGGNGVFMLVIDIARFAPVDVFKRRVDEVMTNVKASKRALGVKEIMIPGEPEVAEEARRLKAGIFVEDATWAEITTIAQSLGIDGPRPI